MENKIRSVLGIDVGGTKIKAGLVDSEGKIYEEAVISTKLEKGSEYVLGQIAGIINTYKRSVTKNIDGVGLALPGAVDDSNGQCLYCSNLGWENIEIRNRITAPTGIPLRLINDANAACLGEYFFGGGIGAKTLLSITLGTGVGSGLIINGHLFNGASGSGVEAGHMVIEPNGYQCTCGRKGCWETLISASGIVRRTKERMKGIEKENFLKKIGNDNLLSTEAIFQAYREGDSIAKEVVDETISYLVIGLTNLINLFNPSKISLGGGVAEADEIVTQNLMSKINNEIFHTLRGKVEIYKSVQGYYGGVVGAACLWLRDIKKI
ncbi:MAG: ROK family protein [Clostridia bacterium]|nr:ROK family protein [Clostridia bacterium]MDD4047909.1 ROK family protein [Clostridia bacterium]